jgi:hypothetical protein
LNEKAFSDHGSGFDVEQFIYMIESLLAVGLLYILPITYQARTKFKEDKLTVSSSIISSFVVITVGYAIFGFYFYIIHSIMNYFISLQLHGFIIFILGALLIVGGVFILMFTIVKVLGFLDKKLEWKR